jgi:hypothetical protein
MEIPSPATLYLYLLLFGKDVDEDMEFTAFQRYSTWFVLYTQRVFTVGLASSDDMWDIHSYLLFFAMFIVFIMLLF